MSSTGVTDGPAVVKHRAPLGSDLRLTDTVTNACKVLSDVSQKVFEYTKSAHHCSASWLNTLTGDGRTIEGIEHRQFGDCPPGVNTVTGALPRPAPMNPAYRWLGTTLGFGLAMQSYIPVSITQESMG